ncbi:MAG: hypothetical protein JW726_16015, partial [Anaerolineales bacterium]|nr:hypothetical protein [Anaerolineales bacterium]
QAAGIALHQPLAGAVIALDSQEEATALHPLTGLLADALRVRKVTYEVDEALSIAEDVRITLDTHLSAELIQEGLANEFIQCVQDFRQKAGFGQDVSIRLFVNATPRLAEVIGVMQDRIMEATKCLEIKLVGQQPSAGIEQGRTSRRLYTMVEFDGERVTFGIEKATGL